MDFSRNWSWTIKQSLNRGQALSPAQKRAIASEPPVTREEMWLLSCFYELSTERQRGLSMGPIPASKITAFAERAGLDWRAERVFTSGIRVLDGAYIEWHADNKPAPASNT